MTDGQMKLLTETFREAAAMNSEGSPYFIATVLGAAGAKQTDELANEIALWAISFCGALNDKAHG